MSPTGSRPILAAALWLVLACGTAGCDDGGAAAPVADDGDGAVPVAAPDDPPAALPAALPDGVPAVRRPPIPVRPRDPAARRAGLVELLRTGEADQVRFAQRTLGGDGDVEAVAAALRPEFDEALQRNPAMAANLLGSVTTPELARELAAELGRCLREGTANVRRLAVVRYAGAVPEPDATFIAELVTLGWRESGTAALEALKELPAADATAALLAVLPRTGDFTLPAALMALGEYGDAAALEPLRRALEDAAAAGDARRAEWLGAAIGLARLGDESGVAAVRRWVQAKPAEWPLGTEEEILARRRDPALRVRLLAFVDSPHIDQAAAAVRLLTLYPEAEDIRAALDRALERPETDVVLEALDARRVMGLGDHRERALQFLGHDGWEQRYAAANVLGRFRDPATAPAVASHLRSEEHEAVLRKCVDALGLIGDPVAAPAIVGVLIGDPATDPTRATRAFTARANLLGPLAARAQPLLIELLDEGALSSGARPHALRAVGQGPRTGEALRVLVAHLKHASPLVREAAGIALGDLGDAAARDDLAGAYAREPMDAVAHSLRDAILRLDLRVPDAE